MLARHALEESHEALADGQCMISTDSACGNVAGRLLVTKGKPEQVIFGNYFDDVDSFTQLLRRTRSVVVGGTLSDFFRWRIHDGSHIMTIYVHDEDILLEFVSFFEGEGYERRVRHSEVSCKAWESVQS
jgi:hypothetical protein